MLSIQDTYLSWLGRYQKVANMQPHFPNYTRPHALNMRNVPSMGQGGPGQAPCPYVDRDKGFITTFLTQLILRSLVGLTGI